MATPTSSAAPEETLAAKSRTFGLFSMVLFSVSAILVADTVVTPAAGAWVSTIISLFIGWRLCRQAGRKAEA